MAPWIQVIFTVLGFALVVFGAAIYLKSTVRRTNNEELAALVDTRGEKIDDLTREMSDMRRQMDEMRGEMKLLKEMKAEEIAQRVVELLPK